jgi:hypothetical protein
LIDKLGVKPKSIVSVLGIRDENFGRSWSIGAPTSRSGCAEILISFSMQPTASSSWRNSEN